MNTNSLDLRNLRGGFIGGVLGILAASYIHEIALPFGCILGAIVGFQWRALIVLPQKTVRFAQKQNAVRKQKHPVEKAKNAIFYARCAGIITFVISYSGAVTLFSSSDEQTVGLTLLGAFMFLLSIVGVATFASGLWPEEETIESTQLREMSKFYKLTNLHAKLGPLLFAREFFVSIVITIATPVMFVLFLGIVWVCVLLSTPFIAYWTVARSLYGIISRKNHILCTIVTTIVTGTTAYFLHEHLSSTNLWLVALTAGFLSGFASLGAHALLQQLLKKQWVVNMLALEHPLQPFEETYSRLYSWTREQAHRLFAPAGWQYHQ